MAKKFRALIVEDVVLCQKMLERFIESYGRCDSISGGEEAFGMYLKALKENDRYDVIFLDIYMPGMNGLELLGKLREYEEEQGIEIENRALAVMVTSQNHEQMVNKAYELGCNGYITKPYTKEEVLEEIKSLDLIR